MIHQLSIGEDPNVLYRSGQTLNRGGVELFLENKPQFYVEAEVDFETKFRIDYKPSKSNVPGFSIRLINIVTDERLTTQRLFNEEQDSPLHFVAKAIGKMVVFTAHETSMVYFASTQHTTPTSHSVMKCRGSEVRFHHQTLYYLDTDRRVQSYTLMLLDQLHAPAARIWHRNTGTDPSMLLDVEKSCFGSHQTSRGFNHLRLQEFKFNITKKEFEKHEVTSHYIEGKGIFRITISDKQRDLPLFVGDVPCEFVDASKGTVVKQYQDFILWSRFDSSQMILFNTHFLGDPIILLKNPYTSTSKDKNRIAYISHQQIYLFNMDTLQVQLICSSDKKLKVNILNETIAVWEDEFVYGKLTFYDFEGRIVAIHPLANPMIKMDCDEKSKGIIVTESCFCTETLSYKTVKILVQKQSYEPLPLSSSALDFVPNKEIKVIF